MKLYKEASLMMLPTSVKDGKLYSIFPQPKPLSGELVTNGDFSDGLNGWVEHLGNPVVSNGVVHFTGDLIKQSILTIDKTYKVTVNVTEVNSGLGKIQLGSTIVTFSGLVEEQTFYVTATDNVDFYIGRNSSTDDFKIDNVSVVEVDQVPADFDFSRGADRATRVTEQGLVRPVEIVSDELVQNGDFEEIGDELITNGGFDTDSDWSFNPSFGVTIENGVAKFDNVNAYSQLLQHNVFTSGKTYKISFSIRNYSGGSLTVQETPNVNPAIFTTGSIDDGDHDITIYYKATTTSGITFKVVTPATAVSLELDNISVKEVGQNWTFGDGWSYEDGVVSHTGSTTGNLITSASTTINKLYKVQFEILSISDGVCNIYDISGTTYASFSTTGLKSAYITKDSSSALALRSNSSNVTVDNISVVEVTEATDLPRLDWSGDCPVLLLEPQRTNLVEYSEDFSQWQNGGGTQTIVANSTTSPQGLQNASSIQIDSGYVYKQVSGLSVLSGDKYTWSCYVNSASQKITFGGGSVAGTDVYSSEDSGNGWYRQKLTRTFTTSGSIIQPMFLDSISGTDLFYIWGAQLEQGSYATSYIPTRGQAATRAADDIERLTNLSTDGIANNYSTTIFFEGTNFSNTGNTRFVTLYNAGISNNPRVLLFSGNNYAGNPNLMSINLQYRATGQSDVTASAINIPINTRFKAVIRLDDTNLSLFVNGVKYSKTIVPANDIEVLDLTPIANDVSHTISELTVFPKVLSDNECINLTTI